MNKVTMFKVYVSDQEEAKRYYVDQLGFLLLGIWTDLWPGDNDLTVPLGPVGNATVIGTGRAPSAAPIVPATVSN